MEDAIMWWGYLHQNGTIQLKRWFGDHKDYTDDCEGNDFVHQVVPPFKAATADEAYGILEKSLGITTSPGEEPSKLRRFHGG